VSTEIGCPLPDHHVCPDRGDYRYEDCFACRVVWDMLLERGVVAKLLKSSLLTALGYHPQEEWRAMDLEEIVVDIDNGSDEPSFTWVLKAKGKWMAVRGWHDYTGWDCQSGLSTETYPSKEEALRTLVDWEREELSRRTESEQRQ
jgi:hypothetical protein